MNMIKVIILSVTIMLFFCTLLTANLELIFIFLLFVITIYWFYLEIEETEDISLTDQINNTNYIDRIFLEVKCEDNLCKVINEAVKKDIIPNFNQFDYKELQFMLCYAKMMKEIFLRRISDFKKLFYFGIVLIIVPFFKILFFNYSEALLIWIELVNNFLMLLFLITTSFTEHGNIIFIIILWIIVLVLSPFFINRNTRFNSLIKRNEKIKQFYKHIILSILLLFFIISSLLADKNDIITIIPGLILIFIGFSSMKYIRDFLNTNERIILYLNKYIIFYGKQVYD